MDRIGILIVEDDGIIATRLRGILIEQGYDVVGTVASGEEALQRVAQAAPDLVLMDIYLAGELNGVETAAQIHDRSDIPVVYLTAYSDNALLQQAKATAPFGYLIKPIQERELRATIEMALYRSELERKLKKSQDQVRKHNQFLNTILEAVTSPFYVIDAQDFTIQIANSATVIFGNLSADSTCYALTHKVADPCGGRDHPCPLEEVKKTGKPVVTEHIHYDHSGNARHYEVHGYPIFDDQGQVVQMIEHSLDITERKLAEEALAWEAGVNAAMAELSRALISPASLEDISLLVLEHAKRLTGSAFGFVGHIDPQTGALITSTMTRDIWDTCQVAGKSVTFHTFQGLWGWVLENRRPLLTNKPADDPRSGGVPQGHIPIHRFLSAPALIGEDMVGQVALANPDRDYSERDLALIERLASLYALAVQRERAETSLRRYADGQAALYAVASAVATSLDPDELLRTVLSVVLRLLGSPTGWVLLPGLALEDPPRVAAWHGISKPSLTTQAAASLYTCPVCGPVLTGRSGRVEPQLARDCPHLPPEVLEAGMRSHVVLPLSAADEMLGVIHIAWPEQRTFSESDRVLLRAIGRQVGMALHNAQLFQSARQVDRLQALNQLDQALTATLDPETVAEATLYQIAAALDVPAGGLLLLDRKAGDLPERILLLEAGWVALSSSEQDVARSRELLQRVQKHRRPIAVSSDEFAALVAPADRYRGRAEGLAIPIRGKDELIAVLLLSGRLFTDEDRALLQAAAGRAGQALQNARLYDELKTLLREREQTQAKLIHSEKMSALGRLVASIAHEINNPLQSMDGCLTLAQESLADGRPQQKLERYLSIIGEEIDRVSDIVQRMRDFYRPARQVFEPTDLHAVLKSVLELSSKQLQHSGVTVRREWADDLPLVPANPDHLKQVFLNLVLNAIDAMPRGGTLGISTALGRLESPGNGPAAPALRIEFSDTGEGIPPEVLPRLFEPFFTTKEHGSGLGLSISYSIVQSHNGQITATSALGEGTTFTILLPLEHVAGSTD